MAKSHKKIIIKTVAITILAEFILGLFLGIIIYYNYDKISASKSGISKNVVKIQKMKIEDIKVKEEKKLDDDILYEGILGKIEYKYSKDKTETSLKEEKLYTYNFNQKTINKYIGINFLYDNKLLDKYIYNYLMKHHISDPIQEINNIINYALLTDKITIKEGKKLINKFQVNFKIKSSGIINTIKTDNFSELSVKLVDIENHIDVTKIPENVLGNNGLLKNENFQYVLSKLYDKIYIDNIKKSAKEIGIDYKLILSSIAVEQLRFLTTDRGYAKNLIKNNKYLTNFTKFSYGLGGIKTHTFNNINYWIRQYNKPLYNSTFRTYDNRALSTIPKIEVSDIKLMSGEVQVPKKQKKIPKYDEIKIKHLLENHYIGTLYVGGLVYSIKQKRNTAGFNIDNRPGVIFTLYNMGNKKTPHGNPDLGGSLISVEKNKKMYFGEIGLVYFNYIKYYLNK